MLQTKAKVTGDEWGDNYYLVGPYTEQGVRTQVELLEPPTPALKRTLVKIKFLLLLEHFSQSASFAHLHVSGWELRLCPL